MIDQSDPVGFLCIDQITGEDEFHGAAFSDQAGQPLRSPISGNDAQIDFGLPETGCFGSNA